MVIDIASPDIANLWNSMRSPNWVVLLASADGTILHTAGNHNDAPKELRLPLQCGRRLAETEIGTNAPAVALSELEVSVIQGAEHFLEELSHFSCAAAPVFGLDGSLTGVLDVTGFNSNLDPRALQRVSMAARSIENRLFEVSTIGVLFGMHEDPRLIGTPFQGLLLVRDDGRMVAANRVAKQMFNLDQNIIRDGQTVHFDQLFEQDLFATALDAGRGVPFAVRTGFGTRLYIVSLRHSPGPAGSKLPVVKPGNHSTRNDAPIDALLEQAELVLRRGIPVLLRGETGTGKEWVARRLHERIRPGKPFIAINCSAIAESLAEAELFGYEEGAYTGSRKGGAAGKIEKAQGGTLFLDEIGDMPLALQSRLLRTLQERTNTRIGGHHELKLDLIVLSATHRDLKRMAQDGAFREDLYFRLNGFSVPLPALRNRNDIAELIDRLLAEFSADGPIQLPDHIRSLMQVYDWPGNIRELRHVLEVACALAGPGRVIQLDSLPEELVENNKMDVIMLEKTTLMSAAESLEGLKESWVSRALYAHNGNISAAAKSLGVSRTTLYKYLRR
ncbi:sigma-54-dependent Fis family transcriptional regulator [Pseudomonas hefeiensis]|uniref:Sigma-54-dependent Fis family transcriptional regulator n=2 Tax=Pseudomonas hefeiensis TaxID=2738125 RepID=A0ABY9GH45_9PSED|nr:MULTISPECIES: sigma-54-dependent Fis family transcriptional regulator [unclassified Pseudomonas]WLH14821.1 sigma-54-dependent Fis family transcriptional regulator [Pseudomonas sp. FP205]WLI42147.1 sigma-54-dependent Fis family transcriptional regulator [Pseudomonas sp. FP821]